jgi:hypothetical protein
MPRSKKTIDQAIDEARKLMDEGGVILNDEQIEVLIQDLPEHVKKKVRKWIEGLPSIH